MLGKQQVIGLRLSLLHTFLNRHCSSTIHSLRKMIRNWMRCLSLLYHLYESSNKSMHKRRSLRLTDFFIDFDHQFSISSGFTMRPNSTSVIFWSTSFLQLHLYGFYFHKTWDQMNIKWANKTFQNQKPNQTFQGAWKYIRQKINKVWYSLSVITNLFKAKCRKKEPFFRKNTSFMHMLIYSPHSFQSDDTNMIDIICISFPEEHEGSANLINWEIKAGGANEE